MKSQLIIPLALLLMAAVGEAQKVDLNLNRRLGLGKLLGRFSGRRRLSQDQSNTQPEVAVLRTDEAVNMNAGRPGPFGNKVNVALFIH